ncbi:MAG: septation protein A [Alphaproteobacteria bacterium CG11_big_fil_rev_8_21_14_0_20_39_49]|nr:MAG: septation protein A [Alphaproteobacteria bacterium CG11_big_fil_rev_8_21_14_0_20_39_49]
MGFANLLLYAIYVPIFDIKKNCPMKKIIKPAAEYAPLILFFAIYKGFDDLILATIVLVIATLIGVGAMYMAFKKVPMMPLIAAAIVAFFGGLTVLSGDGIFIKIKPTVVNVVFALILFAGLLKGKGLLKYMFGSAMQMPDSAWKTFSLRWAVFFLVLAVANEIVWRNFTEEFWVNFKVFGLMGATFIFVITQVPFLQKNIIEEDKKDEGKT